MNSTELNDFYSINLCKSNKQQLTCNGSRANLCLIENNKNVGFEIKGNTEIAFKYLNLNYFIINLFRDFTAFFITSYDQDLVRLKQITFFDWLKEQKYF